MSDMRIAILTTPDSPVGALYFKALYDAGYTDTCVFNLVVSRSPLRKQQDSFVGRVCLALLRRLGLLERPDERWPDAQPKDYAQSELDFQREQSPQTYTFSGFQDERFENTITQQGITIAVAACGLILPAPSIALFKGGVLNGHPAPLPEYRGLDALLWALMAGAELSATAHMVDAGIDSGPIVCHEVFAMEKGDDLAALKRRATAAAVRAVVRALEMLAEGFEPQVQGAGTRRFRMSLETRRKVDRFVRRMSER